MRMIHVLGAVWLALSGLALSACAPPEDPARVELRERLGQETRLSEAELGQLFDDLSRTIKGQAIKIKEGESTRELIGEQRTVVFGMLTNRAGVFDEGLRQEGGTTYRVLNGPGLSNNAEIEASERLWVDVETLLPFRYQFAYAFPGHGDYAYDLILER